jgi:hypothetical protein
MPFCTNCGSSVPGQFCEKCGTPISPQPASVPPPSAVPPIPPQPAAQAAPAAKKKSPVVWILAGCFGLIVIAGVIALAAGWFVAHKARQAGLDPALMRKNPAVAMAKLMAAVNPDVDVVSVDEDKGLITLREKSSGKTVTLNLEDVKKGKISFKGDSGEEVSIQGDNASGGFTMRTKDGTLRGSARWSPPDWIPVYAGAKIEGGANVDSPEEDAGAGYLSTPDSIEDVLKFYENALKGQGFQVSKAIESPDGKSNMGTLSANDEGTKRFMSVIVMPADGVTRIHINFSVKK